MVHEKRLVRLAVRVLSSLKACVRAVSEYFVGFGFLGAP